MKRLIPAIAILLFTAAGCGQSGPLYVPGNPSKVTMPPPPEAPAEDSEEDNESDDN